MRVYENLMGNGSKINASEIVTKNPASQIMALDKLGVEYGQNENGHFVRWGFGWQECWINGIIVNLSGVAAWDAVNHRWTFPKEFWGYTAVVDGMARGSGGLTGNVNLTFVGAGTAADNESVNIRVCLMNTTSTQTECYVNLKAIGWWKEPGT